MQVCWTFCKIQKTLTLFTDKGRFILQEFLVKMYKPNLKSKMKFLQDKNKQSIIAGVRAANFSCKWNTSEYFIKMILVYVHMLYPVICYKKKKNHKNAEKKKIKELFIETKKFFHRKCVVYNMCLNMLQLSRVAKLHLIRINER